MKKILISAALTLCTLAAMAEGKCEIALGMQPITEGDNIPAAISRQMEAKLRQALTFTGVSAADYDAQFFITGRFDHAYSQQAAGPSGKVLVKTNLQLAICDGSNRKTFATATFPLKGVGNSDEHALTKCLSSLNAGNQEFRNFVDKAKDKIVEYFNANYPTYINKANLALKNRDYGECLYWATMIPECCDGYAEAAQLINVAYTDKVNYDAQMLLAQAEGAWAADPTADGAREAYSYLAQIDPAASCYPQAKALGKKIGSVVKQNYDFETKEKYRNAVALEKQRIDAVRDIAVAWAQNQPKTVVKNNWIAW